MNDKKISVIFGSKIIRSIVIILILTMMSVVIMVSTISSYVLTNENIKWSDEGNTFKLTPIDNTVTEKEYTIKAIEFPSAVRGYKTLNGSIYSERYVEPFTKFELYMDIVNNTIPIDTFIIGIGDEYITSDQEMRITIKDIPGGTSQNWVYEYYNPWAVIKIQKRSVPNLDIAINLRDIYRDNIDNDDIKPGDNIDAEIRIKNVGDDTIKSVDFNIDYGLLTLNNVGVTNKLKDTIYQLNKDEEKVIDVSLIVPISLEEKEYEVRVNVTGLDIKDIMYYFNTSKTIKAKSDMDAIYIEKHVSKNTTYLKEYVSVALNIVNTGHAVINNIQIRDEIPDRLILVKNGTVQNYKKFSLNRSFLGPFESWTISYSLKPTEPGIYILPKFDANFSVGGKDLSATSSEVGFRVFGPQIVLTKSAVDMGYGIINVIVSSRNVGNGPTRVIIEDTLPSNTVLVSGNVNATMSLDANSEKVVNYTIRSFDVNISNVVWAPAKAIYYLDDWRFNTSSDEKYEEGHKIEEGQHLEGGTKTHANVIVSTLVTTSSAENKIYSENKIYPEVDIPKIEEEKKQVVATIPAKTPAQIPEKSIPGFVSYELILLLIIIILSDKMMGMKR